MYVCMYVCMYIYIYICFLGGGGGVLKQIVVEATVVGFRSGEQVIRD